MIQCRNVFPHSRLIESANDTPSRVRKLNWSRSRAHHDVLRCIERLRLLLENLRHRRSLQSATVYVLHKTDDSHPLIIASSCVETLDSLSYRIFAGPVAARHGLVDDDRGSRTKPILFRKEPSFQERNAEYLKIVAAHSGPGQCTPTVAFLRRAPLDAA